MREGIQGLETTTALRMNLSYRRVTIAAIGLATSLPAMAMFSGGSFRWLSPTPDSVVEQPQDAETPVPGRAFYFTRAVYSGQRRGFDRGYGRGSWATDWPKADIQFLIGVKRLTNIDAYEYDNPVRLDDPNLRRYPLIYALEVGYMALTEPEVVGLRGYLLAGGFLVIDDFWGSYQWANFEQQIRRVVPEFPIVDIPLDHPLLNAFYNIDEIVQVPNVGNGRRGGPTWERDGFTPKLKGIFDDRGRLMVVINWNTDLGDAWEWAEDPWYPIKYSNFAYSMGINMIVYGMSH